MNNMFLEGGQSFIHLTLVETTFMRCKPTTDNQEENAQMPLAKAYFNMRQVIWSLILITEFHHIFLWIDCTELKTRLFDLSPLELVECSNQKGNKKWEILI